MKRLTIAAVLALMLAAVTATPAAARHTLPHRVAALEAKVNALQKKTNALQKKTNALFAFTHNCIAWDWAPVASYGDWEFGEWGYLYDEGDGTAPFLTTALDFSPVDDADMFVPALNPSCIRAVAARTTSLRSEVAEVAGRTQSLVRRR